MQLIHHPGAHLHQAVALPQPLPRVTVVPARYPDLRKTIFPQYVQDMGGVLASGLLLACSPALSLGGLADPQLEVQFAHQPFEPTGVPARFHPHAHMRGLPCPFSLQRLGFLAMAQWLFTNLPSVCVHPGDLLKLGVNIRSLYLVCVCPIRWLCVSGELDRVSAGGRSLLRRSVMESISLNTSGKRF